MRVVGSLQEAFLQLWMQRHAVETKGKQRHGQLRLNQYIKIRLKRAAHSLTSLLFAWALITVLKT